MHCSKGPAGDSADRRVLVGPQAKRQTKPEHIGGYVPTPKPGGHPTPHTTAAARIFSCREPISGPVHTAARTIRVIPLCRNDPQTPSRFPSPPQLCAASEHTADPFPAATPVHTAVPTAKPAVRESLRLAFEPHLPLRAQRDLSPTGICAPIQTPPQQKSEYGETRQSVETPTRYSSVRQLMHTAAR